MRFLRRSYRRAAKQSSDEFLRWYAAASAEANQRWQPIVWTKADAVAAARANATASDSAVGGSSDRYLCSCEPCAASRTARHRIVLNRLDRGDGSRRKISAQLRIEIADAHGQRCAYCGGCGTPERGPDDRPWHVDHIVPVSKGGTNDAANLALACATCNLSKGAQLRLPKFGPLAVVE